MTRFRAAITPDTDLVVAHDGSTSSPWSPCCRALRPLPEQALADGERKTGPGLPATGWR